MNEQVYSPAKWLRYLLYVSIAAVVNSTLGSFLLSGLSRWVGIALSAAVVFLLFRLRGANPRYLKAAGTTALMLVCTLFSSAALTLVASVCGIVAQYQEYHGHSELVADRDPRLAEKWNRLFWVQFVGGLIVGALVSLVTVIMVMISGSETGATLIVPTVITVIFSLVLRALYLVNLHRTVKLTENEFVV